MGSLTEQENIQHGLPAGGRPAATAPRALTGRSFGLGLGLVALLCAVTPYTDLYRQGSQLVANHLPLGAFCLFLLVVALAGVPPRLSRRWSRLSRGELLLIFVMLLVAAGIPIWGLAAYLFPAISAPQYYHKNALRAHLPEWMVPQDAAAIQYLYAGLPAGSAIPWQPWVRPLLAWSALAVALFLVMISLSVLVAGQWIRRERLAFPLMHIPLEITARGGRGRAWNWRDARLWAGMGLPLALHSLNGLHTLHPAVPHVELRAIPVFEFSEHPPWSFMRTEAHVFFSVVGIAYLLPSAVSFSVWFFFLVEKLQAVAAYLQGADVLYQEAGQSQYIGAFAAFVGIGLWLARPHLREVLAHRWALLGLLVGSVLIVGWFRAAGAGVTAPLLVLLVFVAVCLGLGRLVAQSGVLTAKATQITAAGGISGFRIFP